MLHTTEGRGYLYQWDIDQRLVIEWDCEEVHFAHAGDENANVLKPYEYEGKRVVDVPNYMLQSAMPILVYIYAVNEDESHTIKVYEMKVFPREKPADYVYTETEVLTYEALDKRLKALEENGSMGGADWNAPEGAPGHVLNRTHWVEQGEETVLEENMEFTGTDSSITHISPNIENGKTYTVVFDGKTYTCTGRNANGAITVILLGNASLESELLNMAGVYVADTSEPFLYVHVAQGGTVLVDKFKVYSSTAYADSTVPLKIVGHTEVVHKLPDKFLPDGVPYSESGFGEMPVTGQWREERDEDGNVNEAGYWIAAPIGLEVGKTYVVNWDGTDYEVTGQDMAAISGGEVAGVLLGNLAAMGGDDSGEPFIILEIPAEFAAEMGVYGQIMSLDMSINIPFTIYCNNETIHKLDNKFLDLEWIPSVDATELIAPQRTGTRTRLETDYVPTPGQKVVVYFEGIRLPGVVGTDGENTWITPRGYRNNAGDYFQPITEYPPMPPMRNDFYLNYTEADGWVVLQGAVCQTQFTIAVYEEKVEQLPEMFMPAGFVMPNMRCVYKLTETTKANGWVEVDGYYKTYKVAYDFIPTDAVYCIAVPDESCRLAAIVANVRMGSWDTKHYYAVADKQPPEDLKMTYYFYAMS